MGQLPGEVLLINIFDWGLYQLMLLCHHAVPYPLSSFCLQIAPDHLKQILGGKLYTRTYLKVTCKWHVETSKERTLLNKKRSQIFAVKMTHKGSISLPHNGSKPFETLLQSNKEFPGHPVNKRSDLHLFSFPSYGRFLSIPKDNEADKKKPKPFCYISAPATSWKACLLTYSDK